MTIAELGAVGEFVGSIAVLATLVYLALQMKQTQRLLLSSILQARSENNITMALATSTNPSLAAALEKSGAGEALTAEESRQVRSYGVAVMRNFENLFAQHKLGTLDEDTWRAADEGLRYTLTSAPAPWAREGFEMIRVGFRPDFRAHVDSILQDPATSAR